MWWWNGSIWRDRQEVRILSSWQEIGDTNQVNIIYTTQHLRGPRIRKISRHASEWIGRRSRAGFPNKQWLDSRVSKACALSTELQDHADGSGALRSWSILLTVLYLFTGSLYIRQKFILQLINVGCMTVNLTFGGNFGLLRLWIPPVPTKPLSKNISYQNYVVFFPLKLPMKKWFNIYSLLPRHRLKAVVNWSVACGLTQNQLFSGMSSIGI